MSKKYKRSLTLIAILICISLSIGIAYLFYDKVLHETEVYADGDLSINYINGASITANGAYSFSVTNNGTKDLYYLIAIDNLIGFDRKLSYSIKSAENNIDINGAHLEEDSNSIIDNVLIKAGSTQNYTLEIQGNTLTSFNLNVKKVNDSEEYFYTTIMKNNTPKTSPVTAPGEALAITNEGLIEDVDDFGFTYYFRGNIVNNYVKFADHLWRIVRINGDGSVKLVLNDLSNELSNYHTSNTGYEKVSEANIMKSLNAFYENELSNYDSYIASAKFCEEIEKKEENIEKYSNAYSRLITNKIPTFNCLGDKYSAKIGLLSVDEIAFAGASFTEDNKDFYLYNKDITDIWWTSNIAVSKPSEFYPFTVDANGRVVRNTSGTLYRGVRPVINIIKKVLVTGDGTLDNPYMLKDM